ncbi:MFS transporter [Fictibacillus phosphorivorans]|uniref:MFS transporter n=1 Tax=Fictibacillus phosphorivorans TaxID=1221500 RepID=UPI001293880D|nr:MFS transporter [Fictibacillus phosphorivorans]MQR94113.1 MFS transporter [Fictibacillus phosphorivorans]
MNFFSFHRNIQLRLVLQFITTFASSTVIPFLAIFFSNQVGVFSTGLMYIGVILSGITGALIGGRRSDQFGRKRVILLSESMIGFGYLIAGVLNLLFPLSAYVNFVVFIVILFFTGMAGPAYGAIIIDSSRKENRKAIYTISYWLGNLAVAAGGVTGAILFKTYPYELFLGIALVTFITWVVTWLWLEDVRQPSVVIQNANETKILQGGYKNIFLNRKFILFTVAGLFLISLEESLTTYIGIKLVSDIQDQVPLLPFTSLFEVDGFQLIGLLKAENTILVVVLSLFVATIFKRFKDRSLMLGGGFAYAFGFVVISYITSPIVLIIAMFIASVGELIHIPAKQAYVASIIPDDARGSYMAIYGLSFHVSGMIAALFVMLSGFLSANTITLLFSLMGVTSLIIYHFLFQSEESAEAKIVKTTA